MTPDEAVALSLDESLPRVGLAERLRSPDQDLLARARRLVDRAHRVRETAALGGILVLPWNDARFPAALLTMGDCPPAIWCRGSVACLDAPAVAVVGSRAASSLALEIASTLGDELAARGITVVSGMARGVDSAAHRGALTTGRTAAVLGSGLDRVYPREHEGLAREIAGSGVVVSEYPPDAAPLPFRFPLRNRIISGLARAVVVVEAHERSGSLITAACALDQGRDVMAVPGNVLSGRHRGCHALIRDGATIVETADDIVEELGLAREPHPSRSSPVNRLKSSICEDPLIRAMDAGHAYDVDALAAMSGLSAARLLARLVELELRGAVRRVGGGRFSRS